MTDSLDRLAIHTQTTRRWNLRTCCERYAAVGVKGISVWRHLIDPESGGIPPDEAARIVQMTGLVIPALVRAGFFVSPDGENRLAAIDDTRRAIDDARTLNADQLVLVVGAHRNVDLTTARAVVLDAIASVADQAQSAGIRLAIEPLHPMYAGDRSCVNTLAGANDLCDRLDHPAVGIAVDAYHVWWDPDLADQINRAGRAGRILGVHLCDWKTPLLDPLNDRGLMGDGCIDVAGFARRCDEAGFTGMHEVEVFSNTYWAMPADALLMLVVERYQQCMTG